MKVVWLCSRTQLTFFSHLLFSDEFYKNNKADIEALMAYDLKREEYEDAKQIKNGYVEKFNSSFGRSKYNFACVKELCRAKDEEDIEIFTEREFPETFDEERPINTDNTNRLGEYDICMEKTMYMPVMVTVPDDSTEDEIKQALMEKMNRVDTENKYGIRPVPIKTIESKIKPSYTIDGIGYDDFGHVMEPYDVVKWGRKEDALEYDEKTCDIFQYEWYKYYKRPIFGKIYETEYEVCWELSRCRLSYSRIEKIREEREEEMRQKADDIPDMYYMIDGGDVDGAGFWDEDFEFHESKYDDDDDYYDPFE